MTDKYLDIVIPVRNEEKSLEELCSIINNAMNMAEIEYNMIFVVDPSTDNTVKELRRLSDIYPITTHIKEGTPGKGFSLIEGTHLSNADVVAFIDGDLQYDPNKLPEMYKLLVENNLGVVIANRKKHETGFIRKFGSLLNRTIVGKIILGLDCDIQSGMKVFKRDVFKHTDKSLIGPWTFDIPLLYTAVELGYSLGQVDIDFNERKQGESKVRFFKTAVAIASCGLRTRFKENNVYLKEVDEEDLDLTGSMVYKKKHFITHNKLPHHKSAIYTTKRSQRIFIFTVVAAVIASLVFFPLQTGIVLIAILSTIYFIDVIFSFSLIVKSLNAPAEISFTREQMDALDESKLPFYTIMCPLYKEPEVFPQFIEAIDKMEWPKEKLEVLMLLEENDKDTIEVAHKMNLPKHIKVVIVPHSFPKTKPKACNYGINRAKGDYVVVYDAEDIPDPDQLKKAYMAFQQLPENVVCVQAKLNYYNPHQNLLTTLFTAEYSLWFDIILPGLQSINTIIPLGGTSNHFRTKALQNIHSWDPFNVTEDCDLGVRLFKDGYKTAIIDSTTLEEANSNLKNWIRQRSRWIKGYLQTYLVHMRDPIKFFKQHKWHALIFQLIIGLRISFILINPILWATTIAYFAFYKYVGATIEALYPTVVFYMAAVALIFGNFLYLYNYMIGLAKRHHWGIIKYVFLVPFYWAVMGLSALMAFEQLIFKPHYWEKTHHGLHMNKAVKPKRIHKRVVINFSEQINSLRGLIQTNFSNGAILVAAALIGNVLNFAYNAYLSRKLSIEDFGLIGLVGNFIFLFNIITSAIYRTVTHQSAVFLGKFNKATGKFWAHTRRKTEIISFVATAAWIAAVPFLTNYFKIGSLIPLLLLTPVWIIGMCLAVDSGFLNGNLKFQIIALVSISEALAKFVYTFLFVTFGLTQFIYAVIPLSMLSSFYIAWYFAIKTAGKFDREAKASKFPMKFLGTSALMNFSSLAFLSFDVILAKHYLDPTQAGQYVYVALIGKMIFFFGSLFSQFILPMVSKAEGAKTDERNIFYKLLLVSTASSIFVYIFVGALGFITAPILFGAKVLSITHLLPIYGLAIIFFSVATNIVSFHQIKNKHVYPTVSFILTLIQVVGIGIYHRNIGEIVYVMVVSGAINLGVILAMHFFYDNIETIARNILDGFDLFSFSKKEERLNADSLNVLIFNWRDTKHIWAGGAEVYVHEIAKRLVEKGHYVTVFCGNDGKSQRHEVIDGVNIIRKGGFYTVYIWAFIYYILKLRNKYDFVIDSENGIPFFTPLYVRKPVIGLVHHVHQDIILKELQLRITQLPAAFVAKTLESKLMPLVYANTQMITVSESSLSDMKKIGLGRKKEIVIVNPGVDPEKFIKAKKTKNPTILYLGRLKPYKSIDVLVKSMEDIVKKFPNAKLKIAGFGESRPELEKQALELGIAHAVEFLGKVTEEIKVRILAESWVFAYPSSMEGWGISIIEANASGTPVVAANVPGLRDSVRNPHTGFLVTHGDHKEFANKIIQIIEDDKLRKSLEKQSIEWSKNFTWDRSTEKIIELFRA